MVSLRFEDREVQSILSDLQAQCFGMPNVMEVGSGPARSSFREGLDCQSHSYSGLKDSRSSNYPLAQVRRACGTEIAFFSHVICSVSVPLSDKHGVSFVN